MASDFAVVLKRALALLVLCTTIVGCASPFDKDECVQSMVLAICASGVEVGQTVNVLIRKPPARRAAALSDVASRSSLSEGRFHRLSEREELVSRWRGSVRVAALSDAKIVEKAKFLELRRPGLEEAAQLPPAIRLSADDGLVRVDQAALQQWDVFYQAFPAFDNGCVLGNKSISCRELLRSAKAGVNLPSEPAITRYFRYLVALQAAQRMLREMQAGDESVVFVADSEFPPQVDALGDLYLPANFATKFDASEQRLILAHEAAHAATNRSAILALYLADTVREMVVESRKANRSSSSDAPSEREMTDLLLRFYGRLRGSDEAGADLLAAHAFHFAADDVAQMRTTVAAFESPVNERVKVLRAMEDVLRANRSLEGVLLARQKNATRLCGAQSILEYRKSWEGDRPASMVELRNALADYTAYVLPSRVSVIADPGVLSKIPLVQWVQDTKTHLAHFGCAIVHVKRTDGSFFNLWFHSIDYIE